MTVGFLGEGKLSAKAAEALLEEFTNSQDGIDAFILPLTEEAWTKSMAFVATYAENNDIPIIVVTDDGELTPAEVLDVEPKDTVKVKDVPTRVIKLLTEVVNDGADARLFMLWDDTAEDEDILDRALDAGLTVQDLTHELAPLRFEEVEAPDDDDDDDDDAAEDEEAPGGQQEFDLDPDDVPDTDELDRDVLLAKAEQYGIEVYRGMRTQTLYKAVAEAVAAEAQESVVTEERDDTEDEQQEDEVDDRTKVSLDDPVVDSLTTSSNTSVAYDDEPRLMEAQLPLSSGSTGGVPAAIHLYVNVTIDGQGDPVRVAEATRLLIQALRQR